MKIKHEAQYLLRSIFSSFITADIIICDLQKKINKIRNVPIQFLPRLNIPSRGNVYTVLIEENRYLGVDAMMIYFFEIKLF